jgi:hypothetical protein
VIDVHSGHPVEFPVELAASISAEQFECIDVGPIWASRSASWKLARSSLRWASKHLTLQRANTLFPLPFEHRLIHEGWEAFEGLGAEIELREHRIEDYRQMFAPKAFVGRRVATQLDPLDALLLTAVVYELGECLERARLPIGDAIVHSFRFAPDSGGRLWNPSCSYDSFVRRSCELLDEPGVGFVAETDISAFYHSIPIEALSHSIERIGVDAHRTQVLCDILSSFSREGLPVGPSFSSLLAETVLTASDEHLRSRGCRFVRFNDDYRIFCRTEVEAQGHLQDLAEALAHSSALNLQEAKTRIWDKDSFSHYVERQNNGWLKELRAAVAVHEDPYGEFPEASFAPEDRHLIESAKALLLKTIDESHVAWTGLCRRAFSALPVEERLAVLPQLLRELPRIWGLAPQISWSLSNYARIGLDDMTPIARAVLDGLTSRQNNGSDVPEYAIAWVLEALSRGDWPDRNRLLELSEGFPENSPVRRELLLALRGCDELYAVRFNKNDPWQLRAFSWASGISESTHRPTPGPEGGWYSLLDRLVATRGA